MKPESSRPVCKQVQQMNLTGILSNCRCAQKEIYYWKRKMVHRSQEKQTKFPFLHSTYYLLFLGCLKLFGHLFLLFDVILTREESKIYSLVPTSLPYLQNTNTQTFISMYRMNGCYNPYYYPYKDEICQECDLPVHEFTKQA